MRDRLTLRHISLRNPHHERPNPRHHADAFGNGDRSARIQQIEYRENTSAQAHKPLRRESAYMLELID